MRGTDVQRERWERLERLFAQGLTLPETQRAAWLARACGDDAELRGEVEALMRADATTGVLDMPVLAGGGAEAEGIAPSLAAGTRIGAWRIEKLVGRGGMGEVYAATRAEAGFSQRGALKLLRFEAIDELARFHAERQILARLDHAGIARLLDGGVAPDGRPYTVMEFVEGVSLIDWCNARRAPLEQRLDLFAQVCDAVAYAHRNLVIHRDLKPGNTLVDAEGKVKLLDFGIAKLLDAGASAAGADSPATIAPFTPDYAAPEQLAGEPVTTATDVYALGVLLFELLTGERPLRLRGLPSTQALALLNDREAPLASRAVRDKAGAPVPAGALAGDLDAIVAKCLRRESAHRYDTVNGLKLDLQRHRAREPVLARDGAHLYVFGRVLRRYRWAVAAAAALILALAAGLAGTLWQARRAETQARTAMAVQAFVTDLFRANSGNQKDPVKARATTARELLDLGANKIDAGMSDAPAAKLSVSNLLADLYDQLALRKEEIRLRRQAVELTRSLYGADSAELVGALSALAGAMHGTDAAGEREPLLREALAILDRNGDRDSELRGRLLQKFFELYEIHDPAKALDYARQSVRVLATHPASADLAEAWYVQGLAETQDHKPAQAVASLNRAIEISGAVQGVPNPKLIVMYYQLAETQSALQDFDAAERSARQALQMALAINGEDHIDAVRTRMMLGEALLASGRVRDGLDLLALAKRGVLKLAGPDDPFHTPQVLTASGLWQSDIGDVAEGLADLQAVIPVRRREYGDIPHVADMMCRVATDLTDLGHYDEVGRTLDEAARIYEAKGVKPGTPRYNAVTKARLWLALAQGRIDEAHQRLGEMVVDPAAKDAPAQQIGKWLLEAEIAMETANVASEVETPLANARAEIERSGLVANRKLYLSSADLIEGESRLKRHDAAAALPLLQRALAVREELLVAPNPRLAEAQTLLATCYLELGKPREARELAASAAAIEAHYAQLGERYRRPLAELQARLQTAAKPAPRLAAQKRG
ncbi:MAG: serine/threonine-protein kinase [Rudaea sp.]|uniref:protein kinase domain-containing protein n=1 Tax=Rudaea sp. TaxID=2136325 RepID=UPI0039E37358